MQVMRTHITSAEHRVGHYLALFPLVTLKLPLVGMGTSVGSADAGVLVKGLGYSNPCAEVCVSVRNGGCSQ